MKAFRGVVLAALLGLAGLAAPAVPAESISETGLREGDYARYVVVAGTATVTIDLMIRVAASCTDGFGIEHQCQLIAFSWDSGGGPMSWGLDFSIDHAEAVSAGIWSPGAGGFQQQLFAARSPSWDGHPWPLEGEDLLNARKVAVVGVTAAARAAAGGTADSKLAGAPVYVDRLDAHGSPLTLTSEAPWGHNYRYIMTFESSSPFPATITLDRSDSEEPVIAEASLVEKARGSGPTVDLSGWDPLQFPLTAVGMDPEPWGAVPPGGDSLFLKMGEAVLLTGSTPEGLLHGAQYPNSYMWRGTYVDWEEPEPLSGIEFRHATWVLVQTKEGTESRRAGASASAPLLAPEARVLFAQEGPEPEATWIPSRDELPEKIVSIEAGLGFGASLIPFDPQNYYFSWHVAQRPEVLDAPDSATYVVHCGTPLNWGAKYAVVSAVNGQALFRANWNGGVACVLP